MSLIKIHNLTLIMRKNRSVEPDMGATDHRPASRHGCPQPGIIPRPSDLTGLKHSLGPGIFEEFQMILKH